MPISTCLMQGRMLDFSIESGEIESLVVPSDGTYIVNAFAYEGATNYILAIGDQRCRNRPGVRTYDIVPWQSVVKYRHEADPKPTMQFPPGRLRRRMGFEPRAGGWPGRRD